MNRPETISVRPDWSVVRTVLLDMDGTLLDLHFDSYLWKQHLPVRYAEHHGIPAEEASALLVARIRAEEGTLNWYCLDYWTRELGLDISLLEGEVSHKIALRPQAEDFLRAMRRRGLRMVLATNAHRRSLALKLQRTGIGPYFDAIVSAHDFGHPKEHVGFWRRLRAATDFDPASTLLVDDNPQVLRAARDFGIRQLLAVAEPDSRGPRRRHPDFDAIDNFRDILPA